MCTRILNNIDRTNVTVGRCMDWEFDLPSYVYARPACPERIFSGVGPEVARQNNLKDENILKWSVNFASVSTQIGQGNAINTPDGAFGADDGMNEAGLVVNILYDADVSYGTIPDSGDFKALSTLRWGQFVLDSFSSVDEVVNYFEEAPVTLVEEKVPGDDASTALIHIAVSDDTGDSAILEVRDGLFHIYHSADYTVVTNNPGYATQCALADYWFYQWNLSPTENRHPVYTAPGGSTPAQRFERACFYRYMYLDNNIRNQQDPVDRLLQVRSMVNTCTVPLRFNANPGPKEEPTAYTLWVNLADINRQLYYFLSAERIGGLWFDTHEIKESKRICVNGVDATNQQIGLANDAMVSCDMLFMD